MEAPPTVTPSFEQPMNCEAVEATLSASSDATTTFIGSPTPETGKPFRIQTTRLFLTYPQCPLRREDAISQIERLLSGTVKAYIVAQEAHSDENHHLHVFLVLTKRFETRDNRFFDLLDPSTNQSYHPNVQAVRNPRSVMAYCIKEDQSPLLSGISESDLTRARTWNFLKSKTSTTTQETSEYHQAMMKMEEGAPISEAIALIRSTKRGARDLLVQGEAIQRNLRRMKPRKMTIKHTLEDFPGWTIEWDRSKTLILTGVPNTGKTALAKALQPDALFVTHLDQLRDFSTETSSGTIFDEGSYKHIPREAQIHLIDVEEDRTVHCRYAAAFLPAGTLRIITTNAHPRDILNWDDFAIRRRCQWVEVRALNVYHNYGCPATEQEHISGKCEKKFTLVQ